MKLNFLQDYLKDKKIDLAILMDHDPSIIYFTQNNFSHVIMAIGQTDTTVFLSKLDKKPDLEGFNFKELNKNWINQIYVPEIKKIGINKLFLTVKNLDFLKEKFPKAEFLDLSEKLIDLRQQKTNFEIKKKEKACEITVKAFNQLVKELPKGNLLTEQDVALFIEKKIRQEGAELAFSTIVACGKNAATPHHCTSNKRLHEGFLLMDFGAKYQNYCADMTRVIFLGTANTKEREIYNLLLEAQEMAIKTVKKGLSFIELDKLVRKKLGKYTKNFIHSLGHGIGIEVHEEPFFSNKEAKIEENVPFTIEPGIYLPGKFGLRIEDTIILDEKVRILTNAPKNLIEIAWNSKVFKK